MVEGPGRWPYVTVPVDGAAEVDEDGENQVCECGNDSWTEDWRHADRLGRLSFASSGSDDPEEFAVCPVCGRVYSNALLFVSSVVPAVVRYDVGGAAFIADLVRYDREAYGPPLG